MASLGQFINRIIQTSNVFVANLPPHVTEQTLGNFFARVGPVGSVSDFSLVVIHFIVLVF